MEGWISVYRCLLQKAVWQSSTPEQKTIFMTLLLMANHEKKEWEWNGLPFKAEPGQLVTSIENIQKLAGKGISRQNVRTALAKFEKYGFLTNESTKTGRLITIVNWDKYQIWERKANIDTNRQLTDRSPTANRQLTPNNNDNNYNNDNKKIYAPKVSMTAEQYQKLVDKFGEKSTKDRIESLSLYKASKGRKYKCDYSTMLAWDRRDNKSDKPKSEWDGTEVIE